MSNILLNSLGSIFAGQEILIVAVLILVLFGGAKIPQLMRGLGQGLGEFKDGLDESKRKIQDAVDSASRPSPARTEEVKVEDSIDSKTVTHS